MKISGLMVFKNESLFFIRESVLSFLQLCDEIICVDSGCTDEGATVKVLESIGDERIKIVHKTQLSDKNKEYGSIKNWGMQFCKGDYIFSFDADEVLGDEYYNLLEELKESPEIDSWNVEGNHYYWFLNKVDNQLPNHFWQARLFKNNGRFKYPEGKAHGLIGVTDRLPVLVKTFKGVFIHHYGYCKNLVFDLGRYVMNYDSPEIHSLAYLNEWFKIRALGSFPTREVDIDVHPSIIKDKFKMERWKK